MVAEYLQGISTAISMAKRVKKATDAMQDAELKIHMADLLSALADAKMRTLEDQERIAELEELLKARDEMVHRDQVYFRISENGEDGPYCPRCFDVQQLQIRLHDRENGYWGCLECGRVIGQPNRDRNIYC